MYGSVQAGSPAASYRAAAQAAAYRASAASPAPDPRLAIALSVLGRLSTALGSRALPPSAVVLARDQLLARYGYGPTVDILPRSHGPEHPDEVPPTGVPGCIFQEPKPECTLAALVVGLIISIAEGDSEKGMKAAADFFWTVCVCGGKFSFPGGDFPGSGQAGGTPGDGLPGVPDLPEGEWPPLPAPDPKEKYKKALPPLPPGCINKCCSIGYGPTMPPDVWHCSNNAKADCKVGDAKIGENWTTQVWNCNNPPV